MQKFRLLVLISLFIGNSDFLSTFLDQSIGVQDHPALRNSGYADKPVSQAHVDVLDSVDIHSGMVATTSQMSSWAMYGLLSSAVVIYRLIEYKLLQRTDACGSVGQLAKNSAFVGASVSLIYLVLKLLIKKNLSHDDQRVLIAQVNHQIDQAVSRVGAQGAAEFLQELVQELQSYALPGIKNCNFSYLLAAAVQGQIDAHQLVALIKKEVICQLPLSEDTFVELDNCHWDLAQFFGATPITLVDLGSAVGGGILFSITDFIAQCTLSPNLQAMAMQMILNIPQLRPIAQLLERFSPKQVLAQAQTETPATQVDKSTVQNSVDVQPLADILNKTDISNEAVTKIDQVAGQIEAQIEQVSLEARKLLIESQIPLIQLQQVTEGLVATLQNAKGYSRWNPLSLLLKSIGKTMAGQVVPYQEKIAQLYAEQEAIKTRLSILSQIKIKEKVAFQTS